MDDPDGDSFWLAVGSCMTMGALGFGLGMKLRITRDIVNAS